MSFRPRLFTAHGLTALALAALGLAAVTASCTPSGSAIDPRFHGAAKNALEQLEVQKHFVPHAGERRIRTTRVLPTGQSVVSDYRESIRVDAQGAYQQECFEVLASPYGDAGAFMDRMNSLEGFLYRYRDFHVHDADLLLENYVVLQFGVLITVARQSCYTVQLERRDDPYSTDPIVRWDLAIDTHSGLVLQWQRSVDGVLTDEGVYEWIEYNPSTPFVAHVPSNSERSFDAGEERDLFDYALTTPTLLPLGFQRIERARVVDPSDDSVWLKETFSDGVEVAFFLYKEIEPAATATTARSSKLGTTVRGGGASSSTVSTGGSELVSVESGDVGITQFVGPERTAVVAGRIGSDDRRWMLESALF